MITKTKISAKQVQQNLKEILSLEKTVDKLTKERDNKIHDLGWNVYREAIVALEHERDQAVERVRADYEVTLQQKHGEITNLAQIPHAAERILDFLRLDRTESQEFAPDEVKAYHDRYLEDLGYIFNDDFLKIKLFIAENGKPKKKFSLVAMGKCLFHDGLLKLERSYGVHLSVWGMKIEVALTDAPTIDELKGWFEKRKQATIKKLIGDYDSVKSEYLGISANYTISDFTPLILATCKNCGRVYSIFESLPRDNKCYYCEKELIISEK